ncbi:hypothetical protein AAU61_02160 [Desulfocarbo indianensis]|nr:hypothetical protein AAU61_02160 [Desulfocarbo indianensis]
MAGIGAKRTAVLFALFCALGLYAFFAFYWGAGKPMESEPGKTGLPVVTEGVDAISIQYRGQRPALVFAKQGGDWWLTRPRRQRADNQRVREILEVFQYGYVEVVGRAGQGLQPYGLDKPALTVTLTGQAGGATAKTVVALGADTPSGAMCYCLVEPDPRVFTVGVLYKRELEKGAEYYLTGTD